jgi:hypothetical protein
MTKNDAHFVGAVKKAVLLSVASRMLVGVVCEPGGYCAITPIHVPNCSGWLRFGEFFATVLAEAGEGVQFVVADGRPRSRSTRSIEPWEPSLIPRSRRGRTTGRRSNSSAMGGRD